ncbi:MAG: SDR family oxidoreductase [Candidatus Methanosuratincola sp.]
MRGKKVVVTGGAGFIGSNLAEALSINNEVVIVDDFSTGKLENIKDLVATGAAKLVNGSVTDLDGLRGVFEGTDFVFHLAAIPSVPGSIVDPIGANEVGIKGTLNVLVAARDCGVRKVVFASSSSVYGDTNELPKREGAECRPISPYALTKLVGEHYCRIFTELYGLETVSLRYFNVYGPKQDPNSEYAAVVPRFIVCALKGRPFLIHGDGSQTRDFIFVKDAVMANIIAAESPANGIYNIAGGKRTSILELAKIISEAAGSELKAEFTEPRKGDIKDSYADISKARKDLGFEPSYPLEKGIAETLNWYKTSFQMEKMG